MEEQLTALLASVAGGRRYWVRAAALAPVPYVLMNRISALPSYTHAGKAAHRETRVQIDCYARTFTEAKALASSVETILSGYRGGVIQGAFIDGIRDLPAEDVGPVLSLFRVEIDVLIHHTA